MENTVKKKRVLLKENWLRPKDSPFVFGLLNAMLFLVLFKEQNADGLSAAITVFFLAIPFAVCMFWPVKNYCQYTPIIMLADVFLILGRHMSDVSSVLNQEMWDLFADNLAESFSSTAVWLAVLGLLLAIWGNPRYFFGKAFGLLLIIFAPVVGGAIDEIISLGQQEFSALLYLSLFWNLITVISIKESEKSSKRNLWMTAAFGFLLWLLVFGGTPLLKTIADETCGIIRHYSSQLWIVVIYACLNGFSATLIYDHNEKTINMDGLFFVFMAVLGPLFFAIKTFSDHSGVLVESMNWVFEFDDMLLISFIILVPGVFERQKRNARTCYMSNGMLLVLWSAVYSVIPMMIRMRQWTALGMLAVLFLSAIYYSKKHGELAKQEQDIISLRRIWIELICVISILTIAFVIGGYRSFVSAEIVLATMIIAIVSILNLTQNYPQKPKRGHSFGSAVCIIVIFVCLLISTECVMSAMFPDEGKYGVAAENVTYTDELDAFYSGSLL